MPRTIRPGGRQRLTLAATLLGLAVVLLPVSAAQASTVPAPATFEVTPFTGDVNGQPNSIDFVATTPADSSAVGVVIAMLQDGRTPADPSQTLYPHAFDAGPAPYGPVDPATGNRVAVWHTFRDPYRDLVAVAWDVDSQGTRSDPVVVSLARYPSLGDLPLHNVIYGWLGNQPGYQWQEVVWDTSGVHPLGTCIKPGFGNVATDPDELATCLNARNAGQNGFELMEDDVVPGQPYTATYFQDTVDHTGWTRSTTEFVGGLASQVTGTLSGPAKELAGVAATYSGRLLQDPAPPNSGAATTPLPWAAVALWSRPTTTGAWALVATAKTGADGRFTVALPAGLTGRQVQARLVTPSGTTSPGATASGPVTTYLLASATTRLAAAAVPAGGTSRFTGQVNPHAYNLPITVLRCTRTTLTSCSAYLRTRTSTGGVFAATVRAPTTRGAAYYYRLQVPSSGFLTGVTTAPLTLKAS